jgi:hypothetical protein
VATRPGAVGGGGVRYHRVVEAFEFALDDEPDAALERLDGVLIDAEQHPELALWEVVVLGRAGRLDEAEALGRKLEQVAPGLAEAGRRFADANLVERELIEGIFGR